MSSSESHPKDGKDLLADAIVAVRQTDVEDMLVETCRRNALAIEELRPRKPVRRKDNHPSLLFPLAAAASILLMFNLLQAYARLPSSDRRLAAVYIDSDSRRLYVYSDLRFEPAPSLDYDQGE
ncbi:MAG: hypothetical protein ACYC0X_12030 [Pirellulaceae bacterium]